MCGYRIPLSTKTVVFQGKYKYFNMLRTRPNSDYCINDRPHGHITIKAQGFWLHVKYVALCPVKTPPGGDRNRREQRGLLTMHLWWAATFWLSDTSSWPHSLSRLVLQKAHLGRRAPAPFLCADMTKGFSGCLEIDLKKTDHQNCAGTSKSKHKTLQHCCILTLRQTL